MAKAKLGSGARFKALEKSISKANKGKNADKKIKDPAALAAAIGRKKYGAAKMAKLAAAGKKKGKK